jgi:hypothetical protein
LCRISAGAIRSGFATKGPTPSSSSYLMIKPAPFPPNPQPATRSAWVGPRRPPVSDPQATHNLSPHPSPLNPQPSTAVRLGFRRRLRQSFSFSRSVHVCLFHGVYMCVCLSLLQVVREPYVTYPGLEALQAPQPSYVPSYHLSYTGFPTQAPVVYPNGVPSATYPSFGAATYGYSFATPRP